MKKLSILFLLVVFCLGVGRTWYWATDGFRLSRIEGFEEIGKERAFSEEAEVALSQRFFYLARGRQCFAFVSEDGKYVLKFPRLDRYKDRILFCAFPSSSDQKRQSNLSRKERLFDSFEIACDQLQEDTAILAMYNAPKTGKEVEIVDRLGRKVRLPLEKTGFILQRKLPLFKDVFQEAFANHDLKEINRILDRLLAVVVRVADRGIVSKDGSFLKNFAFDEKQAYQIDVGSYYRMDHLPSNEVFAISIHSNVETLRAWLRHKDPAFLALIDEKLDQIYAGVK